MKRVTLTWCKDVFLFTPAIGVGPAVSYRREFVVAWLGLILRVKFGGRK